jgi:hypothetical protein
VNAVPHAKAAHRAAAFGRDIEIAKKTVAIWKTRSFGAGVLECRLRVNMRKAHGEAPPFHCARQKRSFVGKRL